ncbi:MAG: sulfatase-like hydrolase/transferase [Bacteroidetes bacterium]|nr:sulfatase-like hydrolase/transferase [Bacteroidota bacterium]
MIYGIRFDISVVLIVNAPLILLALIPFKIRTHKIYDKIFRILFLIVNSLLILPNLADLVYFKFAARRTTSDMFNIMGTGDDFWVMLPKYIRDFWYIMVIWIFSILLMRFLLKRTKQSPENYQSQKTIKYYGIQSILFLLLSSFAIIGMRGGLQLKPISIISAGQYFSGKNIPLILNTPFTIIKTLNKKGLENVTYFKTFEDAEKNYSPVHKISIKTGEYDNSNVVVIILESFSKEHIGFFTPQKGKIKTYTPFLDSLIKESLTFKYSFANAKRSIEGIPAVLAGIPTLMNIPYISSEYSLDKINSVASLLSANNYQTAFYHGGKNGTMGFDNFTIIAGFEKYYGKNEYNNDKDFDGEWGIYDEEYLQYFAKNLSTTKTPFVAGIFTLSSHHPYTIPSKYKNKFSDGKLKIQKSIMYTDFALKRFFETASKMPWFDNTLFVITADHTSESADPFYQSRMGEFAVPIIYYKHNSNLKAYSNTITQQSDILPSVMDFLNYKKQNYIAFGESVFDSTKNHFAVNYLNDTYVMFNENYALEFDGNKSLALYEFRTDSLFQNNLLKSKPQLSKSLEKKLKAIIQSYNYRLINNKLSVN